MSQNSSKFQFVHKGDIAHDLKKITCWKLMVPFGTEKQQSYPNTQNEKPIYSKSSKIRVASKYASSLHLTPLIPISSLIKSKNTIRNILTQRKLVPKKGKKKKIQIHTHKHMVGKTWVELV